MICGPVGSFACVLVLAWFVVVISGTVAVVVFDRVVGAFVDHEATSWAEAFWVSVIVWALVGGAGVFVALVGRAVGA